MVLILLSAPGALHFTKGGGGGGYIEAGGGVVGHYLEPKL